MGTEIRTWQIADGKLLPIEASLKEGGRYGEYAQAIAYERIQQGEQVDAAEALFSLRETVDRVTRRFALILSGG